MKKIIPGGIAATLIAGGLLLTPSVASASEVDSFGICTPSEATSETVVHPAVGEPIIEIDNPDYVMASYTPGYWEHVEAVYTPPVGTPTIEVEQDNPDYVPATPESTEVIHHEAETEVVYHDEVSHIEYQWKWWGVKDHGETVWTDGSYPGGQPNHWPGIWKKNGNENKVVDQAAWEETVITKEAWDETVTTPGTPAVGEPTIIVEIDNPDYVAPTYVGEHDVWVDPVYVPAVGKPTIEVDNPDYVAEREEVIETDAVVCPPVEEPKGPDAKGAAVDSPEPKLAAKVEATESADSLATTGGSADAGLILGAGALLAAGGALFGFRRIARR